MRSTEYLTLVLEQNHSLTDSTTLNITMGPKKVQSRTGKKPQNIPDVMQASSSREGDIGMDTSMSSEGSEDSSSLHEDATTQEDEAEVDHGIRTLVTPRRLQTAGQNVSPAPSRLKPGAYQTAMFRTPTRKEMKMAKHSRTESDSGDIRPRKKKFTEEPKLVLEPFLLTLWDRWGPENMPAYYLDTTSKDIEKIDYTKSSD